MGKKYNKIELEEAIKNSNNLNDVFKYLKLCSSNYEFLKQKIKEYNIDTSHFYKVKRKNRKLKLEEILKQGVFFSTRGLKEKLYKVKLKKPVCELCDQDENWKTGKITLILDHVDGNKFNNEISNLRIVCPNCDATLPTYKGKNKKIKEKGSYYAKGFEYLKKDNSNKNINLNKIKERIEKINNSNIDFSKHGWRLELAELLDIWPQRAGEFIKKHQPDIWINCYKHKDRL